MALRVRETTGEGQYIDVAMLDGMISTMSSNYMSYLGSGIIPRPMGTSFPTVVPYRVYQTSDDGVAIAVGSEKLWSAFCAAAGVEELEKHPDYATNPDRIAHRRALDTRLAEVFRRRTVKEWVEILRRAGIPCSPVRNFKDVSEDPQAALRGMFPTLDHPVAGPHRVTGTPVKLSATPGRPTTPAPLLGEHTRETLTGFLGLDEERVEDLLRRGVVLETAPPTR
jgi:crotonobetainyl-CoA:carnitine CoA-transferase CaiB-like acyl-CoA transferase